MVEQRKPVNWRVAAIFASGLLLGGAVAAWAVLNMHSSDAPAPPARQQAKAEAAVKEDAPAARPVATVAHILVACPAARVVAAADREDGQAKPQGEPAALILAGKEAAAAGRPRDAELSFLAACKAADKHAGSNEAIDARYQLARHYANLVLVANVQGAGRAEMVQRADVLYADAVQAYRARHGESHEKTRFAAEGLAALRQSAGQQPALAAARVAPPAPAKPALVAAPTPAKPVVVAAPTPAPAPKTKPTVVAAPPPPRPAPVEVVTAPVRQATGAPTQGRPSFDCALARSPAERRICADAELSRLDRDLGRLHARARDAAADSAAFRRQNDREWRRREASCGGDRECLLDWYANRRDQLLEDLNE
jgi:hypothetical protein